MASLAKKKDVSKKIAESSKTTRNKKKVRKSSEGAAENGATGGEEQLNGVDLQQLKIEENLQKIVYDSDEEAAAAATNGDAEQEESSEEAAAPKEKVRCRLCLHMFDTAKQLNHHERNSPYHKRMLLREEEKVKGMTVYTKVATQNIDSQKAQLRRWFEVVKEPLIGLEHIVEVQRKSFDNWPYYVCKLCGMKDMPVFEHLISRSHKMECLLHMWPEHENFILSNVEMNDEEKKYILSLFKDKVYPPAPTPLKPADTSAIINKCVKAIVDKIDSKKVQVLRETAEHAFKPARQKPISKQIKDHKEDNYPESLKKLLQGKGNFGKADLPKKAPMGSSNHGNRTGLLGHYPNQHLQHQQQQQRQSYPPRNGSGYLQAMHAIDWNGPKMSMLDWLHNTATKMDVSAICVTEEYNLGREIVSFLRTGINMFNDNKGYDEIAYYPAIVNSASVSLLEWMRMTSSFFETGWLCSPREVTMAHVVISQLSAEVEKFEQRAQSANYGVGRGRGVPRGGGDMPIVNKRHNNQMQPMHGYGQGGYPVKNHGGYQGQNHGGYGAQNQGAYGAQAKAGGYQQQGQYNGGYGGYSQQVQGCVGSGSYGVGGYGHAASGYSRPASQYDPYSNLDSLTGDFGAMSLAGQGRGPGAKGQFPTAYNPNSGKVYVRRPGKSHYTMDVKK